MRFFAVAVMLQQVQETADSYHVQTKMLLVTASAPSREAAERGFSDRCSVENPGWDVKSVVSVEVH